MKCGRMSASMKCGRMSVLYSKNLAIRTGAGFLGVPISLEPRAK